MTFTKGVPSRVSVKHLIPEGERFHGGYYDTVAGISLVLLESRRRDVRRENV